MRSPFLRFVIVGASNTALCWLIFFTLAPHLGAVPANAMAWTLSSIWSFVWNRCFTFRVTGRDGLGRQAVAFLLVSLSAVLLSSALVAMLLPLGLVAAQAGATSLTLLWNFWLYRRLVFRAPAS